MKKQGPVLPLALQQGRPVLHELAQGRQVPLEPAQGLGRPVPLALAQGPPVPGLALECAALVWAELLHLKIQKNHT